MGSIIGGDIILKIKFKLINIDYVNFADRYLPEAFGDVTEDSKLSMKIAHELLVKNKITNGIAKGILKIIPQQTKDKVAFDVIVQNKDKIIESINNYFSSNQITIIINDILIKEPSKAGYSMLKFEISLNEIDYNSVITNLLPMILNNMSMKDDKSGELAKVLLDMNEIPNQMIIAALNVLPQEAKDELVVKISSLYKEEIIDSLNHLVGEQHITAVVSDFILKHGERID